MMSCFCRIGPSKARRACAPCFDMQDQGSGEFLRDSKFLRETKGMENFFLEPCTAQAPVLIGPCASVAYIAVGVMERDWA